MLKLSCKSTTCSSLSWYKKQAAAEVAARQEVLKIMKEQHQREEVIRKLEVEEQMLTAQREAEEKEIEAENTRKQTQFISERAARRTELKKKK